MKKFDDIWESLPHFSWHQFFLTFLAAGWLSTVIGLSALFPVFGQWRPEFHCETQLDILYPEIRFEEREAILKENCAGTFGECSTDCDFMIPPDCLGFENSSLISNCLENNVLETVQKNGSCSDFSFNKEALGVPKGHENLIFSKGPDNWETTVTYFKPICSRSLFGTFMISASIIGQLIGSFFAGIYSDRFGRKNAIWVFTIAFSISYVLLALIKNEFSFIFFRISATITGTIMYIAALTYGIEVTGPSKRSLPGSFINVYFGAGYMGSSLIGYFIPHWQGHALAIGIMGSLQLILTIFLPESPRFLVAKKKYEEASKVIGKIGQKTGSETLSKTDLVRELEEIQEPKKAERSPLDLFRTTATRKVTLNLGLAFAVTVTVYYALSFNVSSLAGSTYVNNALNGAVETLAYFICIPLIDKFGRRPVTVILMYIGSIAVLLVMMLNELTTEKAALETFIIFLKKFQ